MNRKLCVVIVVAIVIVACLTGCGAGTAGNKYAIVASYWDPAKTWTPVEQISGHAVGPAGQWDFGVIRADELVTVKGGLDYSLTVRDPEGHEILPMGKAYMLPAGSWTVEAQLVGSAKLVVHLTTF